MWLTEICCKKRDKDLGFTDSFISATKDHRAQLCSVGQIQAAGSLYLHHCLFIRGAGQELFRWYTLPQDLTVFCCPQERSEHYPCVYTRRRDEAACESAHTYTWLRAERGNAATAHEEGSPPYGIAVEAEQTRLLSPILPATLVQIGLLL